MTKGTCDACAEDGVEIVHVDPDTEAYTCNRCWEDEELAVLAGGMALGAELGLTLADRIPLRKAHAVIAAYTAKHWERAQLRNAEFVRGA